ncbi:hypothetical protein Cgig2_031605 [Carnegiea gigantea]|uniref:Uncharacterized protein n=1 Tax=Carnegiea gigantea TaxID=171969 RepID=A0A9Q1K075_9CARY|nr:hypothetical protein Cgig2_031605 [Carnegiea gigantea]
MVFPPLCDTEEMFDHVRETFKWHLIRDLRPPQLLSKNYEDLCPDFALSDTEEAIRDSHILEMIQAIFYAMVVTDALELGIMSRDMAGALKSLLEGLRWLILECGLRINKHAVLSVQFRSCEYSLTPSILSIKKEVFYPWEINMAAPGMTNVQEHRLTMTKTTLRSKTPDELMAEGSSEVPPQGGENSSSSSRSSTSRSWRGCARKELIPKVVTEGTVFPGSPERSNPQNRPSTHFPNPKVVGILKRLSLEGKYLPSAGYRFDIPDTDATINKSPPKCIVIYHAAFSYGVRFLLHPVIVEILDKYKLALVQIVPMSWHNICSFVATCELRGLTCTGHTFELVHIVQRAPSETMDIE